jgi:hypothetical protein
MPIEFGEPTWLWLALPAVVIVVAGWLAASRLLSPGRRIGSLLIRLVLVGCLVLSLAGVRLALPADRLSVVFLVDASASMLDATSEELLGLARFAAEHWNPDLEGASSLMRFKFQNYVKEIFVDLPSFPTSNGVKMPSQFATCSHLQVSRFSGPANVTVCVRLYEQVNL